MLLLLLPLPLPLTLIIIIIIIKPVNLFTDKALKSSVCFRMNQNLKVLIFEEKAN